MATCNHYLQWCLCLFDGTGAGMSCFPDFVHESSCNGHPCLQDCNSSVMISAYGYGNETALINDPAPDPMGGAAQDADHLCTCMLITAWLGNWPFMLVARIRPGGQPHVHPPLSVG